MQILERNILMISHLKLILVIPFLLFPALWVFSLDSYLIGLPNGITINAEIAHDKVKGLQGRKSLCSKCGMIFIFDKQGFHSFWMKDTLIDLSVIWIENRGKIVHVVEKAPPCDYRDNPFIECEVFKSIYPSKYVLEINPSEAKGLSTGSYIKAKFLE